MSIEPHPLNLDSSHEEASSVEDDGLHTLFEHQVRAIPERAAVVWGEHQLSYNELAVRADRLARRLRHLGVGPEVLVAVMARRTPELIVALLAVMKAGGAYVPIDPEYPAERRAFILDDALHGASTPIVLTEKPLAELLPDAWRGHAVFLEEVFQEPDDRSKEALSNLTRAENLAYLIYTSGSTGRPKGVAITHGSAARLVHWAREVFSDDEMSGVLAATSVCFDLSVFEIFVTLAWGGRVVLVDNALALGGGAHRSLAVPVTLINTVPSAMAELVRSNALPDSLLTVNLAGEALERPLVEAIYAGTAAERVLNLYGPSEDTTYSTWTAVPRGEGRVLIGRPLPCSSAHVLDAGACPVELGELHLGGDKLARGYWRRPGRTAQSFVPDPFAARAGQRLYRTGDLIRRLPGGELDFRGRLDHQVKIRGFRIELGEVETALTSHADVQAAAVVARALAGDGQLHLVAFFVPESPRNPNPSDLRERLAAKLPSAMVPSRFVALAELPLSPNGKIDRTTLARRPLEQAAAQGAKKDGATQRAPQSAVESALVELLAELGFAAGSVADSFAELGGSSLDAYRLLVRLRQRFGVELDLPSVYHAELAALARRIEGQEGDDRLHAEISEQPIRRRPAGTRTAPLSYAQENLWFFEERQPRSTVYNIARALDLDGTLDASALERAFTALVERHEILRSSFVTEHQQPVQRVLASNVCSVPYVDLRRLDPLERQAMLRHIERVEARTPIDLEHGPLLRALLISWAPNRFRLLLNVHHLAFDGWSIGIFFAELSELYRAFCRNEEPSLPELPVQYGDFAAWQRETLDRPALAPRISYWRQRLEGSSGAVDLIGDHPRSGRPTRRGSMLHFTWSTGLTEQVERLADALQISLFMTLISAWAVLLARRAGQRTLLITTPTAGRQRPETDGLIGLFANALVARFDPVGDPTVEELLLATRQHLLADLAHQDVPLTRLQEELASQGFAVPKMTFAFQNTPLEHLAFDHLQAGPLRVLDPGQIEQDLVLSIEPAGSAAGHETALSGWMSYDGELFEATTAERLLRAFETLLGDLRPERRLRRLNIMPATERHQLLVEGRDRAMTFPRHATVHELFAATAAAMPAVVALVDEHDRHLSYAALDRRANGLAHALTHLGIGVESGVALGLERSNEAVVAFLAVLKAGGVYLPLDPDHPLDRLAFMIGETDCQVLITDRPSLVKVSSTANRCQLPLIVLTYDLTLPRDQPPPRDVDAQNLAYVMFTSGSTGKAKGVAVSHRNVVRLVRGNDFARLDGEETFLSFAPLAFDASTLELWGPLLNGGRLAIFPSGPAALRELASALCRQRVTTLWLTAGLFHQMVDLELDALGGLHQLLAGGDVLSPERARRVLDELPGTTLINGYGPTETTTFACCHTMTDTAQVGTTVAIGRPLGNARVQVLDSRLEPAPIGVAGELMIAGDGVARGYARRPALTAARFLPEPDAPRPGERMYRTGDLVRWLVDSRLEFLGRFDFQVKIRGFRIELGEIQSALEEHPGVVQAIVVTEARAGAAGDLDLVAFAVAEAGKPPANEELQSFLARRLPPYMVPSRIALLDALPLGPTGKVDRAALKRLAGKAPRLDEDAADRTAPRNPIEEGLLSIFVELLYGEREAGDGTSVPSDRLGIEDDFFAHGGHSLLAAQLIARVHALCGVELSLRDFFAAPTVAGLAAAVEQAAGTELPPMAPQPRPSDLPPSFAQERLWFLDQLLPSNAVYNIPWPLRIAGELDQRALELALSQLVARHEVLRTTFAEHDDQVFQVIQAHLDIALPIIDLSGLENAAETAARLAREDADRPFDLRRGPLLRAALLRLTPTHHHLLLNLHHIISDGWSMEIVDRELGELYSAAHLGRPAVLPALPVQYADYAQWQRGWLQGAMIERQIAFWRDVLAGAPSLLELPTDRPRPAVMSYRGGVVERRLDPALYEASTRLARAHQATPFMLVQAVFDLLLMRHAGCDDLCVGFPVAGRRKLEHEKLIGFFVNTLVLRVQHRQRDDLETFLERLRDHVWQALAHQDVPFERLVEELEPERSLSHTPFFQVMLAFLNAMIPPPRMHGLAVERLEAVLNAAKFDLTLSCEPSRDGGLRCELSYSSDLFDATTMERFLGGFETLLRGLLTAPERPLARQPLLGEVERRQIFGEWNDTATALATASTLHEAVSALLAERPDAVAVVLGTSAEQLSGGELARRTSHLAAVLAERGVGPESLVGIAARRSLELVIGLLGILEAGGAYVPIDPSYPPERQATMIGDALGTSGVLVTQTSLLDALPRTTGRDVLLLDALPPSSGTAARRRPLPGRPRPDRPRPDNLAYTIYTSGSTGKPKGAMNAHRAILNRLLWLQDRDPLTADDHVLQKTPFSFDVSVWEFFWPLLSGARLVLARPEGHKDSAYLVDLIATERLTTLHFVPSMLQIFVEEPGLGSLGSLERVMTSGEALSAELAARFFARLPRGVALNNLYGPTEAAVEVTFWPCRPGEEVPIGRPIANTELHILDRRGEPAPIGVAGQLYIAGVQVARGYLDRPRLTAETFLPDPFADPLARCAGARCYATGDLARWRSDGSIAYLGRLDTQVKIRGFRIELGEIETHLRAHPAVRDAVVLALPGPAGDVRLVAYRVAEAGQDPSTEELRRHLGATLPEHMIPSLLVALDALPLNPNGKTDRRALARLPLADSPAEERPWTPPRGPLEEQLAAIWQELLGRERIGAEDHFFALGGHSLLAARLVARIRSRLGVEVPLQTIFARPVLAELAATLAPGPDAPGETSHRELPPLVAVPREGDLPLSLSQERLWFLDQLLSRRQTYNVPSPVRLRGRLDVAALAAATSALAARHEILCTTFPAVDGLPHQAITPPDEHPLPVVDLSALPGAVARDEAGVLCQQEAARPFALDRGPLWRTILLRLAADEHHLLLVLHHIISDGWSLDVVWRDLAHLYRVHSRASAEPLPPLAIQYADFAAWQRQEAVQAAIDEQLVTWRQRLAGAKTLLELPTDRPRPAVMRYRGRTLTGRLGSELTGALRRLTRDRDVTLFMLLLAAYEVLLSRHSGQRDFCVGSPVAGRHHLELEPLIGFFVNTLVLRAEIGSDPRFSELLARARDEVLAAFAHQEVPFEKLVSELELERSLSHSPFFQAMLVVHRATVLPELSGLQAEALPFANDTTKFDLTLAVVEHADHLELELELDRDLFDDTTGRRLLRRFEVLLEELVARPEKPLSALLLETPSERQQLLREWTGETLPRPPWTTLPAAFLAQAQRTPEAIALVWPRPDGEERLSYGELARRSRALAARLVALGVGPEARLGVSLARSPSMVVALLGVSRAGGAYVALDPSYPEQRLADMLADAQAGVERPVLISETAWRERLPGEAVARSTVLWLDQPTATRAPSEPGHDVLAGDELSGDNLAYVLYTSGSTGRPKGVAITHRSVVALLVWARRAFSADELSGVVAATSINFDLSVFELFVPLAWGGTAWIVAHALALAEPALLHRLTTTRLLNTVPSAATELLRSEALPPSLRTVNLAGEPLRRELVRSLYAVPGIARVVDLYGPSEDTTYSTWAERRPEGRETIGRAIAGSRAYVVDARLRPVPLGVVGELCLAGSGLARGYLGRRALTAERFVPESFGGSEICGRARMYRTGDLVRTLADGRLQFLGRRDHQVKVRGFRIELGEIEAHLLDHPAVREAVVLAGDGRLFAFVVRHGDSGNVDADIDADELRRHLGASLPEYMVPQVLTLLDELPLLPNGKIDRGALKKLAATSLPVADAVHVAPRNPLEKLMVEIFADLLHLERASVESSFFALGGHSLLATRVVARIRSRLGVEVPLRQVFETPTAAGLARVLSRGERSALEPIVPLPDGARIEPSFSQERLWFLDQLEPGNSAYNIPLDFHVAGHLEVAALAAALGEIVRRHRVLRTVFELASGEARPRLLSWRPFALPVVDLTALDADRRRRELHRLGREDSLRPFALDRDLMLRARVLLLADDEQGLLLNLHHIAGDGWSLSVLVRELEILYSAARQNRAAVLPQLEVQYADFAAWQRRHLSGERRARQVAFWKEQLAGAPPLLELPTDRPRPAVASQRGARYDHRLTPRQAAALRDMAQRLGATPFMVLLAALGITLGRSSGQSDLVIGAPIAGRLHVATESLIGFFLNNLVLRLRPGAEPGFAGFLAQVRETVLAAYAHQELPFEKLVEELQPERVLSYHPLFQVLLNLHNWDSPEGRTLPLGDLRLTWLDLEAPLAKLDLNVHVLDLGDDGFDFNWLYNRELFDATTITRLAHAFTCFLDACVAEPERPWQQIAWQDRCERHQLLREWNDTAASPLDELLHTRFERRAASAPDAVALVYKASCLSYGELDRRASDLARHLRPLGVGPEKLVGVHLERGLEMVTAVLGALEAGGAYVPLDPALPAERLRIMVDDSHAAAVLTQESLSPGLQRLFADDALPIVVLDGFTGEPNLSSPPNPPEQPSSSPLSSHGEGGRGGEERVSVEGRLVGRPLPSRAADPENLAYVIYTSGTTGRPKGVMCRHQGAVSYLRFMLDTFRLEPGARTLQLASLAFDPSVRELFGPLGSGGTIILIEAAERRDPTLLLDLIDRERITGMLSVVPSLLRTLPDPGRDRGSWRSTLRTVMTNGEQLFLADVRQARQLLGQDLTVINQYGPTECTMVASTYPVPQTQTASSREVALIGRPITGRRVYVLGPDARPTPIGAVGELHIATADLARGYLDRPAQTAQVFLPDPWSAVPGGRRYATGDLVRRLRDGQLEFVGRRDHQVKVLGNRVELPEIEAVLRRHPQVAATVVIAWQKGSDIRLVAYLETSSELSRDALREHVKASLPEYMVPSLWIFLDRLPLNPNGKVDRRALPPPSTAEVGSDEDFIAPRSGVETLLARIWSELLEVERVGVKDSFFHLGGHSLHGIRSLYRLRELLDVDLETRQLFEAQTLEQLAPLVEARLLAQLAALTDDEAARQIASSPVEAATLPAELLDASHEAAPLPGELAKRLLALSPAKLELRALRLHRALELGAHGQAIPRRRDPRRAPLSWIQETFWLIEQQEQSTISVYRSSHRVTLNGRRDIAAMEAAVAAMVERHEILRTRFDVDDEGCTYQEILPDLRLRLPRVDLSALHPEDHDAATESAVAQRSLIALDLGKPPLLHLLLIELSDERAHLLVILHHIITDHWSMGLFLREWRSLYNAATAHRPAAELPELDVQYADYAEWERNLLEGEAMEPLMAYWGEKLAGGMPQLVLRTDRPRPAEPTFRGAQIVFELGPELTQALEDRDRSLGVSLFMTLLAAYKIVLYLHSDQTDILVASPAANRTRIQTEKMLGCFVHMMVLRTDLSGDPTLTELVDRVRETVLGAFAHEDMPFMVLVANFPPPDFAFDRSPFQTSFTFLNAPTAAAAKALEEGSSEVSSLRLSDWESVDRGTTDQDLALWMSRDGGRLIGNLIYDVDLFDRSTVEGIVEDYERVLERLANAPEERLSRLREIVDGRRPDDCPGSPGGAARTE